MIPKQKAIVYSALHTGTWFTCRVLTECSVEEAGHRADQWFREVQGSPIEFLNFSKGITEERINEILHKQEEYGREYDEHIEIGVLQAHQRGMSSMYKALQAKIPEIPIFIPMRDPVLSLNTRVWREAGTIKKLKEESLEFRLDRARDQTNSIARLLRLRKDRAMFVPVDIERTEEEKIQVFKNIIKYANLTEGPNLEESARIWQPVNHTKDGDFVQKQMRRIDDKPWIDIKNDILNGHMRVAYQYLGPEMRLMVNELKPYIDRLKELGYKNLAWW